MLGIDAVVMKKRSEAKQTLLMLILMLMRAGCSKADPQTKQTHKQTGAITILCAQCNESRL